MKNSLQQRNTELRFKGAQLIAQRRLRDKQTPRGGGHAAVFVDRLEILKPCQVHGLASL